MQRQHRFGPTTQQTPGKVMPPGLVWDYTQACQMLLAGAAGCMFRATRHHSAAIGKQPWSHYEIWKYQQSTSRARAKVQQVLVVWSALIMRMQGHATDPIPSTPSNRCPMRYVVDLRVSARNYQQRHRAVADAKQVCRAGAQKTMRPHRDTSSPARSL